VREEAIAFGCVMFTVCVRVHPPASVMVQVYTAAVLPEMEAVVPPDGAHAYV
jgi:hypothetical protein